MRIKLGGVKHVAIDSEFIRLDALLKFVSACSTGGEAKIMIQGGEVFVDGEPCLQRGKKIRSGNVVRYNGSAFVIRNKQAEAPNCAIQ